ATDCRSPDTYYNFTNISFKRTAKTPRARRKRRKSFFSFPSI
ncbi:hypothetical protein AVDCRST_MAG84-6439, partial [uncultured Microcoleus sp.]